MENNNTDNSSRALATSTCDALQQRSQQRAVSLSERYAAITTIAQAFHLQEAPLARAQGNVRKSIILHLGALARFLNLRTTLTEEHIEFIADRILADDYYKWLKPADLKIFFDRIKMGRYGDFYGNLNSISFFQSLDRYMIERNGEIERLRVEERERYLGKTMEDGETAEAVSIVRDAIRHVIPAPPREVATEEDRARKVTNTAKVIMQQRGIGWCEAIDLAADMVEKGGKA